MNTCMALLIGPEEFRRDTRDPIKYQARSLILHTSLRSVSSFPCPSSPPTPQYIPLPVMVKNGALWAIPIVGWLKLKKPLAPTLPPHGRRLACAVADPLAVSVTLVKRRSTHPVRRDCAGASAFLKSSITIRRCSRHGTACCSPSCTDSSHDSLLGHGVASTPTEARSSGYRRGQQRVE